MICWNKVSPTSPYLDDVRSEANEWLVSVGATRSVSPFWILAVGVSIKRSNCLAFGVATSTFFLFALRHSRVSPTLEPMVKNHKFALHGRSPADVH